MRTPIRKIGNSRGILIPAALLAACDIGDTVDMRVEQQRIILEPVAPEKRQGWFDHYNPAKDKDMLPELSDSTGDQDEWAW
ncbi:AbrB/MazE/SpoVT family DNA-binding domain-containing protein [Methylobacillus flagellatus]|uniref:AbrB/MazE/SpoVT family DNA-binding domain-containing protein n=1 Tax=Methylobacillus flagellatus TaxID=405 RepID=UPI0010F880A8|nr:AbrB/MazE/SpoVT family DNA-binding domain-containing protein [Methylobacillus flagellatus]